MVLNATDDLVVVVAVSGLGAVLDVAAGGVSVSKEKSVESVNPLNKVRSTD